MRYRPLHISLAIVASLANDAFGQGESASLAEPDGADTAEAPLELHAPAGSADAEPTEFWDALTGGRFKLDNRLRLELADTTGRDSSNAITNRFRLGYETLRYRGFQAYLEMENVTALDRDTYFVPQTGDGDPTRTVIADPTGTEVNQAYISFRLDEADGTPGNLEIIGGRQRIILDDARFIGNVGWRQFEQTLDAVGLKTSFDNAPIDLYYAYVWHVQRIFGPDGPNFDSSSHLINASIDLAPEIAVTPFAYLLDFGDDSPAGSVDSYGVRLNGDVGKSADEDDSGCFSYEATLATQSDAGDNPRDYDALFLAGELRMTHDQTGGVGLGYQLLGSDNGQAAFLFPLGTNHKFQGFADQFVVTPDFGLQDLYVRGTLADVAGFKTSAIFHQFWSDEDGDDLGYEIDLVARRQLNKNWSVLLKAAYFDGHNGQPDTARFWIQTTLAF